MASEQLAASRLDCLTIVGLSEIASDPWLFITTVSRSCWPVSDLRCMYDVIMEKYFCTSRQWDAHAYLMRALVSWCCNCYLGTVAG